jgi:hypothetical protein
VKIFYRPIKQEYRDVKTQTCYAKFEIRNTKIETIFKIQRLRFKTNWIPAGVYPVMWLNVAGMTSILLIGILKFGFVSTVRCPVEYFGF